jgi:hypothetical protein
MLVDCLETILRAIALSDEADLGSNFAETAKKGTNRIELRPNSS